MLPLVIRSHDVEAGDLVFLLDSDRSSIRFANVEHADDHGQLWISFPVQRLQRRAPAFAISPDDIVLATEIQSAPIGNLRSVGEVLLHHIGPDSAQPYIVTEVDPDGHCTAQAAVRDGSVMWHGVGAAVAVPDHDVFPPVLFSRIARWQFAHPVDPLFDLIAAPTGESIAISDVPANLSIDQIRVPVRASLTITDEQVSLHVSVHYAIGSAIGNARYAPEQTLVPLQDNTNWRAQAAISGVSLRANIAEGYTATVDCVPTSVTITHGDQPVSVTRTIYRGAPIAAWSNTSWMREPPVPALGLHAVGTDCIDFTLYGARTVIYRPATHGDDEDLTAVLRLGEPLDRNRMAVFETLLGYLTGGRARKIVTEIFAMPEKLRTEIHSRGQATTRKQPPIPIDSATHHANLMSAELPNLVDAFGRWRATSRPSFEAAFHHYAEGVDSNYPTTRILRLSVALESFMNLVTEDRRTNEKIIEDSDAFNGLRDHLLQELASYGAEHRGEVTDEAEGRLRRKIENLNSGSNLSRIRRFWQLVPMTKTPEDEALMNRLRNASVHEGFVRDEDDQDGLLQNAADAERLTDIFNRAVLTYAGYRGPVRSAVDARWLHAQTGEPFVPPALPSGPTLQLNLNFSMPPMSAEEREALQALRAIQIEPNERLS